MAFRSRLTDEQISLICCLREDHPDMDWTKIADQARCTKEQARYQARKLGAIGPRDLAEAHRRGGAGKGRRFTDEERQALMANTHVSPHQLAKRLGRATSSVRIFYQVAARQDAIREELGL
jgi:hypothetical protein